MLRRVLKHVQMCMENNTVPSFPVSVDWLKKSEEKEEKINKTAQILHDCT